MLRRRLFRAACLAFAVALWVPAGAHAGLFSSDGTTLTYNADPDNVDQIAGFETSSSIRFTRFGGAGVGAILPCQFVGNDFDTVDCPKANLKRVVLNLGNENDIASVSGILSLPVIFQGGAGNDGLFGGGGFDIFFGDAGDDNIVARDGRPETIDCGDGNDTAISDDPDTRISCEQIEGDADSDGVRRPADCNDTNPPSGRASSTSPTTGSTRTARASMRSTWTATATARRARWTATTPTGPSGPAGAN